MRFIFNFISSIFQTKSGLSEKPEYSLEVIKVPEGPYNPVLQQLNLKSIAILIDAVATFVILTNRVHLVDYI